MAHRVASEDDYLHSARLLSVAIGMIMEDHVAAAVTTLPEPDADREEHFRRLLGAGQDIVA